MAERGEIADRAVEAALRLIAARGWLAVGMADVAHEAGISLADLRAIFPCKSAILSTFRHRTDARVLAECGPFDPGDSVRDRLFDVLMQRFDALEPHRGAVQRLLEDLPRDPAAALGVLPGLLVSMGWMLEAAGLSSGGWQGAFKAKGLAVVWLATLRVWLVDEGPDYPRTMAALDRNLRRVDWLARRLFARRVDGPPEEEVPAQAAATGSSARASAKPGKASSRRIRRSSTKTGAKRGTGRNPR